MTSGSAVNSKFLPMKRNGELCGVVDIVVSAWERDMFLRSVRKGILSVKDLV